MIFESEDDFPLQRVLEDSESTPPGLKKSNLNKKKII
jgi:hypothetical protein